VNNEITAKTILDILDFIKQINEHLEGGIAGISMTDFFNTLQYLVEAGYLKTDVPPEQLTRQSAIPPISKIAALAPLPPLFPDTEEPPPHISTDVFQLILQKLKEKRKPH
jgi:hypothetical protein